MTNCHVFFDIYFVNYTLYMIIKHLIYEKMTVIERLKIRHTLNH